MPFKGRVPWNKGLRKRIKKTCMVCNRPFEVIESRKNQRFCSLSCWYKYSRGKPRIKIRKVNLTKEQLYDLYWNKKLSMYDIAKKIGVVYNAVRQWMLKYNIPRRTYSETAKLRHFSKETREKLRKIALKSWKNNRARRLKHLEKLHTNEEIIAKRLKSLRKRPTSLEKKFMEIIEKHNLPFKYCGDGSVLIGYKNPDFVCTNGAKVCIEIRARNICRVFQGESPEEWARKRIEHFKKWGWKCLVFFAYREHSKFRFVLSEDEIVAKIKEVV